MKGYAKRIGDKKIAIGVDYLRYRKKPCLVVLEEWRGAVMSKYASFNNEDSARKFMDIFADFIGAEKIEWLGEEGGK